tara:strand:+ start:3498 stop:3719 length:222 start_codon:yes stop_codon:yes gene_type:complete
MRKGKKVYILEIWFDDEKGEILSISESCELANNPIVSDYYFDSNNDVPVISLCDYMDDKWIDLIADANVIGLA